MEPNYTSSESKWGFFSPRVYKFRSCLMLLAGSSLLALTAFKPHIEILFSDNSWLPFIAIVLIIMGILRFLDGVLAPRSTSFHLNWQGGIFDLVVGLILLMSVGKHVTLLTLLITCYLITQGMVRLISSFYLTLENPLASRAAGSLSLVTGSLVWAEWPSSAAWFLSLALSIEIVSRGGALLQLARSLEKQSI
ncbi:MAG: HdeD family acid-resistance protein [Gammaproteobacteria bacterium]